MPREEIYDPIARKGTLKGLEESAYFTLPIRRLKKSTTLPERKLYMLHYWDVKNHQVHLFYGDARSLICPPPPSHLHLCLCNWTSQKREYLGQYATEEMAKSKGFACLQSQLELDKSRSVIKVRRSLHCFFVCVG